MKRSSIYFLLIASMLFTVFACNKEVSVEGSGLGGVASGTLLDSSGNCKNSVVKGSYEVNVQVTESNYVLLNVNFATQGKYKITSDTLNGIWFLDSGFAFVVGPTAVKLKARGKPLIAGTSDFVVTFGSSTCKFSVTTGGGVNNGSLTTDYLSTNINGYIDYELNPTIQLTNPTSTLSEFRATVGASTFTFPSPVVGNFTRYTTTLLDTSFFRKSGTGLYYKYGTPEFEYFYIYDTVVQNKKIQYIYLDESKTIGQSWETDSLKVGFVDGGSNTIIYGFAKLKFTILDKGGSASFLGTLYRDIILLKRELYFKQDTGGSGNFERLNYAAEISYAKGIGMVDQRIYNVATPNTSEQSITIKGWRGL